MTEFERVLEECLRDLGQSASNVDECLARHPEYAAQLKPILLTAARIEQGRAVQPSAAFKARARAELTLHIQAHPRRRALFTFAFRNLATALAIAVLALLATGTAYAQRALPGGRFYSWKLLSERAWQAISPDPIHTDLAIANRRIEEMNAVGNDPVRRAQALEGYEEVVARLRSELDEETLKRILPVIELEQDTMEESLQPVLTPTVTDEAATQQPAVIDTPLLTVPEIVPTNISELPATHPTPSKVLPKPSKESPGLIPTIEIPPLP